MHFKPLYTLLVTISFPLTTAFPGHNNHENNNNPDHAALHYIQTLSKDVNHLDTSVHNWDGNLVTALSMRKDTRSAQDDLDRALADAREIGSEMWGK